ncbi:TPA: hypothetical protein DEP90_02715 [Patescibacteria group bacterium]|nr:hypothetical protein [Patescibacteria group bacterium]
MKEINISDSKTEIIKKIPTEKKKVEEKQTPQPQQKQPPKIVEDKKSLKQKINKTSNNISKKKGMLILSIIGLTVILGIATFYYFGIYKYNPNPPEDNVANVTTNYIRSKILSNIFSNILANEPQEPRTEVSPINGLLFTQSEMNELMERRPIAVMINNHSQARPQSGLNSAEVVYEVLVESGITRLLGIFWSQVPDKVGPIRSARQYYLEWLSPYDPLYIYDGCAKSDDPRVNACGNIYLYNIKVIATIGSWRWNDGTRYAPHNEYNSLLSAWEYAEDRGWDKFPSEFESWEFKNDELVDQRGDGYRYKVTFHERINNGGAYDAIWQYDPSTNSYNRWIGGRVDIDQETNTQVNAKVVIIQETDITATYDTKARLIVDTVGQGDAVILMDGKKIDGTWKKTNRMDRTSFYTSDGEKMEFNRGRVWISVIAQSSGKFDIIEQ